jgi:hypothetical protein
MTDWLSERFPGVNVPDAEMRELGAQDGLLEAAMEACLKRVLPPGKERTIRAFYNGETSRIEAELGEIDERGLPRDDERREDRHYWVVMTMSPDGAWQGGEEFVVFRDAEAAYNKFVDGRARR